MMPKRYRKKPVQIEAGRLTYENRDKVAAWITENGGEVGDPGTHPGVLTIVTLEGAMRADPGDYVIRGVEGEFYPCKPSIFEASYELVSDAKGSEHGGS